MIRLDDARIGRSANEAARLRLLAGARLRRYRQYQDFYEGRHFERARNGRSNLVLNYARAVVDKCFDKQKRRHEHERQRHEQGLLDDMMNHRDVLAQIFQAGAEVLWN